MLCGAVPCLIICERDIFEKLVEALGNCHRIEVQATLDQLQKLRFTSPPYQVHTSGQGLGCRKPGEEVLYITSHTVSCATIYACFMRVRDLEQNDPGGE